MRVLKEQALIDGVHCVVSMRFYAILSNMKHPIALELMSLVDGHGKKEIKFHQSFIDATDDIDKVSFSTSSKIIDELSRKSADGEYYISDQFNPISKAKKPVWRKNRSDIKIGKLIRKMFGDKYKPNGDIGNDIESFVNEYKAIHSEKDIVNLFDVVEGDDVVRLYNYKSYECGRDGSILGNSCMNDIDKAIEFYALNKHVVKLLVLYSNLEKTKIVGRALIWKISILDGEKSDRTFMDRIYTVHNYQEMFFKNYAEDNGYLRKTYQSYEDDEVFDTVSDTDLGEVEMSISGIVDSRYFPYLDSLKNLNPHNNELSNIEKTFSSRNLLLDETDGKADNGRWIAFYKKWYNRYDKKLIPCYITDNHESSTVYRLEEDTTFLPYHNGYCANDYIEKGLVKLIETTYGEKQTVIEKDAIFLKHYNAYTTGRYLNSKMIYVDSYGDYFERHDVIVDNITSEIIVLCK